jgi:hypothetical protein
MHEEIMCDSWCKKTNHADFKWIVRILNRLCGFLAYCADFDSVVRIFEDLCGFVMGIFCQMGLESATFSPKKTVPRRFWDANNPHDLSKIRTLC